MTHTQGILEQLRVAEEDDRLPEEHRERARERRKEIEQEQRNHSRPRFPRNPLGRRAVEERWLAVLRGDT